MRETFKDKKRLVVKVGTSTLTHENGRLHLRRMERLVKVLADLRNSGREVILVSSGAISVGAQKLGLTEHPRETRARQASAGVGQCELMFMYDKLFSEYNHVIGQLLLTAADVQDGQRRENLENTFAQMLAYGAIPIVNENDSVAVDELIFGDNDTLSAIVAALVKADLLILLTDIDGLYTLDPHRVAKDPHRDAQALLLSEVREITPELREAAGGRGSSRGTGGMITKLDAAQLARNANIPTAICNGEDPENIYRLLDGEIVGTVFL
ncbi:MAG: glutamate 5-kinase [Clostridiales bacterium]|nr:glutamate 5-kinase [Clostridiales bacterium]